MIRQLVSNYSDALTSGNDMPLAHPTLISDTSGAYFGMRARVRAARGEGVGLRPRYTMPQIRAAIARSPQAWSVWTADTRPKGGFKGTSYQPMPSYLSAYMMLLDGVHPTFLLRGFVPQEGATRFPAIPVVSDAYAAEWRAERDVTHADVSDAFDYQKDMRVDARSMAHVPLKTTRLFQEGDENPNIRQHSVRRIGADGVRWLMLQLMADDHPALAVMRRPPSEAPWTT